MTGTQLLPLTLIDLEDASWPRVALHQERVQDFARTYYDDGPLALDPVEVADRGTGRSLLINGRHRLAARRLIQATDVAAHLVDTAGRDPVEFAYEYALADASRSALPLTRAEKHAAVLHLIQRHPERTDVAIASLVGVSSKTVQRARKWLAENPDGLQQQDQSADPVERWRAPTTDDVAHTMVRQLEKLWSSRPLGMAVGITDSARLGDVLGEAFIDRVGPDGAVEWTERLCTWATRARTVALAAAQDEA